VAWQRRWLLVVPWRMAKVEVKSYFGGLVEAVKGGY